MRATYHRAPHAARSARCYRRHDRLVVSLQRMKVVIQDHQRAGSHQCCDELTISSRRNADPPAHRKAITRVQNYVLTSLRARHVGVVETHLIQRHGPCTAHSENRASWAARARSDTYALW